ncbi:PREDICTED: ubiquitin-conjugating enzyme E2 R1 [Elephantulus edwardii]|uniref:ubiquitin-conjugating enzyme E2 R1 n=1 Tax=Elephantulus edwardii TaxID=28737 RepID=UPI0003F0881C|nr:PREDICTED: ubiquitin-conjugating enzyme E2 R1 [Elephantulus edwardii]
MLTRPIKSDFYRDPPLISLPSGSSPIACPSAPRDKVKKLRVGLIAPSYLTQDQVQVRRPPTPSPTSQVSAPPSAPPPAETSQKAPSSPAARQAGKAQPRSLSTHRRPAVVRAGPRRLQAWEAPARAAPSLPSAALCARGGARLKFPIDYPYSPPAFRFLTKMWHPNIYETGDVCISILHPPVDDPQSGELPSERWNPTQNVRTILLSVISLLNEPNTFSPANVDASVMYRKWKESKGKDREYTDIIRKQVLGTKVDAERDGVKVPTTLAEYCVKTKAPVADEVSDLFYDDYYEDGELEEGADSCFGDEDDSGTEES